MLNKKASLQNSRQMLKLLLEMACAGVTPAHYRAALRLDSSLRDLSAMIFERPEAAGPPVEMGKVQESDRDRGLEDTFVAGLYGAGLRNPDWLDPMLRDELWLGAFVARLKQLQPVRMSASA